MDRFQEMQVFAAVAQEQGFSAAARRLGLSAASVTRAVAALEKRIGTPLLTRTTRSVHLMKPANAILRIVGEFLSRCRKPRIRRPAAMPSHAGNLQSRRRFCLVSYLSHR